MIAVNVIVVVVCDAMVTAVPPTPPTRNMVTEAKLVPVTVTVVPTYPLVPDPGAATLIPVMVGGAAPKPVSLPKPKEYVAVEGARLEPAVTSNGPAPVCVATT